MGSSPSSVDCSFYHNVTVEELDSLTLEDQTKFMFSILILVAVATGVFSNLTFIFVLFRNPNLRSETDVYLAHLSLADLMYLLTSAVQFLHLSSSTFFQTQLTNLAQCIAFGLLSQTSFYASIALVTTVSIERFLALCHPLKHLKIRGKRRTYKLVASCWLFGLLWGSSIIPTNIEYRVVCFIWPDSDKYQDYPSDSSFCTSTELSLYSILLLAQLIPWSISMSSTVYMYTRIIISLHKRRGSNGSTTSKAQQAQQVRNQVAKMLVVNGVVFFLCQAPLTAVNLISLIPILPQNFNETINKYGFYIKLVPQLVNAFINPFIYGAMNSQYRAAFLRAFNCNVSLRMPPSSTKVISTLNPHAPKTSTETMEPHL